ncbi:urea ABC transporter permease subunit UrtB [Nisaea sediminum]|uniref:urea ABC transporter permease subunit UrtB n=1 Tax=Nisaea sediminum TaxID=2775867 RepID=UPI0018687C68|nr:urea ABC transporter permease subunit UrtB [Nisaea sediminum]
MPAFRRIGRFRSGFLMVLFTAMALLAPIAVQAADDLESLVAELGAAPLTKKDEVVERMIATGAPEVVTILEALVERDLYTRKSDEKVVIGRKADGGLMLVDPISGEELGIVGTRDVTRVKTNNSLRSSVKAAMGTLTLMSPDPQRRLEAAQGLLKSSDQSMLPLLEQALAKEQDANVRNALQLAEASIKLLSESAEERLAGVQALADRTDPESRVMLSRLLLKDGDVWREPDETVRAAAEETLASMEGRLRMWRTVEHLYQGISLGSVLLLAAMGLAITFGVMGVINMAHGEMVMLGAYTTFVIQEGFRAAAPELFGWSLAVALPAAFLVSASVGVALERGCIRFLYGRPLETLLATWGISLILQQTVRSIFGPTNREVGSPEWMQGAMESVAGITLTYNRLYIILFSFCVLGAVLLVLKKTAFGLQMRAVTQNREMARAMGIPTGRVDAMTFGLGSGIAGIAGVALSQIDNVSPNLGQAYIVDSFMVVVFGGVGNLWGAFAGAMSLGVVNKLLEPWAGAVLGKILVLVAIILFIQKRPRGLFALRGRAVES